MSHDLEVMIKGASSALLENGELDFVADYFTPDYVAHLTGEDFSGGHPLIQKVIETYRRSFPDIQVTIDVLVTDGDRIAWQRTLRATHEASFKGFPASGRPIVWREMVVSRVQDGLIAEEWVVSDLAERLLLARKQ